MNRNLPGMDESIPGGYIYFYVSYEERNSTLKIRVKDVLDETGALEWLKKYSAQSKTTWRLAQTFPSTGVNNNYKADFRCVHSTDRRVRGIGPSKNTGCEAKLSITVKRFIPKSKRQNLDPLLKKYPCIIIIKSIHNHSLDAPSILRHRDLAPEIKEKFIALHKAGHSPRAALMLHQTDLKIQFKDRYDEIKCDGQYMPTYSVVYHMFRKLCPDRPLRKKKPNRKRGPDGEFLPLETDPDRIVDDRIVNGTGTIIEDRDKSEHILDMTSKNEPVFDATLKSETVFDVATKNRTVFDVTSNRENEFGVAPRNRTLFDMISKGETVFDMTLKDGTVFDMSTEDNGTTSLITVDTGMLLEDGAASFITIDTGLGVFDDVSLMTEDVISTEDGLVPCIVMVQPAPSNEITVTTEVEEQTTTEDTAFSPIENSHPEPTTPPNDDGTMLTGAEQEQFCNLFQRIQIGLEDNPSLFVPAVRSLLQNEKKYATTDTDLLRALHLFGVFSSVRKVSADNVARRTKKHQSMKFLETSRKSCSTLPASTQFDDLENNQPQEYHDQYETLRVSHDLSYHGSYNPFCNL